MKQFVEYTKQIGNRKPLYKKVMAKFGVKRALYPGSHIDIYPSMVIPDVVYIDSFKGAIKFFKDIDSIKAYVNQHKDYDTQPLIQFHGTDYHNQLKIEPVDLIISQYAGFVGQATKQYLKKDGILLCNDSHGDATLAYLDPDYTFIGIVDARNMIRTTNLEQYFTFPRTRPIDVDKVRAKMKGPKYKVQPANYLFQKNI